MGANVKRGQEKQKQGCVADSPGCTKRLLIKTIVWSHHIVEREIKQLLKIIESSVHSQYITTNVIPALIKQSLCGKT